MADDNELRLRRGAEARVRVEHPGAERQPVVCIDHFAHRPEALRARAIAQGGFHDNTGLYPGHRTAAPRAYYQLLYENLPGLIEEVFGIGPDQIASAESSFSLVTTPPAELLPMQRVPHFDSGRPTELAMIHYLCGPEMGGTSFYRHRATGFEWVDERRRGPYFEALEAEAQAGQVPPPAYINGSTDQFERIASYRGEYNRLLIYRCTSLHSGDIPPGFTFETDPARGRLSVNTFLLNE